MSLKDRIDGVEERIGEACRRSGRNRGEVRLVAVSKKFSIDVILEANRLGLCDFGENYAQELRDKQREAGNQADGMLRWHFVGALQRNKVKYVLGKADLIHAVDNMALVAELDKRAAAAGICVRALVEINGGEESKNGISGDDLREFLESASRFPNVSLEGLMIMPPYFEDPEMGRPWFSGLREMRDKVAGEFPAVRELSMGMSNDFEVAIQEGATILRVGSALFGPRPG
ncbi:MAG: YggS family pyridoxal phosphate-dependent enzyme [Candidatus Dadabacteria bacterium]|nr:YggS family pyridoxal phosphate-dependent enzyme [Candidatus Dadabacteria bacterium]MYF48079.1 YggS family pyridoxal phosphate-dependent enzyme [Candidatus Dadabacteria bacterium]